MDKNFLAPAVALLAICANATPTWTVSDYAPDSWTSASDNLLADAVPDASALVYYTEGGKALANDVALLTDGSVPGGAIASCDFSRICAISGGSLAWSFPQPVELLSLRVSTRWCDGGRDGIGLASVSVRIGDSASWTDVGAALSHGIEGNAGASSSGALAATFSDPSGAALASGVTAIRFVFGQQDNSGTGYVEFEATGRAVQAADASPYDWNRTFATPVAGGELAYAKANWIQPAFSNPRYIDFEGGNDDNDGASPQSPWKHHPLDPDATGRAKASDTSPDAYVFKRGVTYRGQIRGKIANAKLLSIPGFGSGDAVLSGAERVDPSSWTHNAPSATPNRDQVWSAPLAFAPRAVWMRAADGSFTKLTLARTPNWSVSNRDDVMSGWWTWQQPNWWEGKHKTTVNGHPAHVGVDTDHLKSFSASDLVGGLVWSEWGIVMGTPFPSKIEAADPSAGTIAFQGFWYNDSEQIITGNRYFLEDRPLFLDEPGEFWFDKTSSGGTLHLRLPGDADPRSAVVEAGSRQFAMDFTSVSNVQISALAFARMNPHWDLEKRPFENDAIYGSAIRLAGPGVGFTVDHCTFTDVNRALRLTPAKATDPLTDVTIADNEIVGADQSAIEAEGGMRFDKINVFRNRMTDIGRRPARSESGHALCISWPQRLHLAGNFLSRCYGAGIFLYLGKGSTDTRDAPFTRALVHHNRVEDSLLAANDWGGIETWQGGPVYVYGNLSINPGGYWNWARSDKGTSRLGFAYYLDGAFKNYHFNNIARGNNNDPTSPLCNRTAVYQATPTVLNAFYNNTYRTFAEASNWSPVGGREIYAGNLFDDISNFYFSHGEQKEDEGQHDGERPLLDTVAYLSNVFAGSPNFFGTLQGGGVSGDLSFNQFNAAARAFPTMGDGPIGTATSASAVTGGTDLTPKAGSAAIDTGVRPFIPWALKRTVGEWNFRRGAPGLDEHWYMSPSVVGRDTYWTLPRNDLTLPANAKGASAGSEDWIDSAFAFGVAPARLDAPADLSPAERVNPVASDTVAFDPADWVHVVAPACPLPGETMTLNVTLKNLPSDCIGQKLPVHIHWMKAVGWGGYLTHCYAPPTVTGNGTYAVSVKIPATLDPAFASYQIMVGIGPSGDWGNLLKQTTCDLTPKDGASAEELEALDPAPQYDVPQAVGFRNLTVEAIANATRPHATVASTLGNFAARGFAVTLVGDSTSASGQGYALFIDGSGHPAFRFAAAGKTATAVANRTVTDGVEHHYLAELDREARKLRLYLDGECAAEAILPDALAEADGTTRAPLLVGSNLTIDFLRIALSSLSESKTDIDELRAWEFDGPFLRDFTGKTPTGHRDAGAIER